MVHGRDGAFLHRFAAVPSDGTPRGQDVTPLTPTTRPLCRDSSAANTARWAARVASTSAPTTVASLAATAAVQSARGAAVGGALGGVRRGEVAQGAEARHAGDRGAHDVGHPVEVVGALGQQERRRRRLVAPVAPHEAVRESGTSPPARGAASTRARRSPPRRSGGARAGCSGCSAARGTRRTGGRTPWRPGRSRDSPRRSGPWASRAARGVRPPGRQGRGQRGRGPGWR